MQSRDNPQINTIMQSQLEQCEDRLHDRAHVDHNLGKREQGGNVTLVCTPAATELDTKPTAMHKLADASEVASLVGQLSIDNKCCCERAIVGNAAIVMGRLVYCPRSG